jgi:hypothetical protein
MRTVTHKAFVSKAIELLKIKSYESIAEEIRKEAQAYIEQVGPENVLWITENAWHDRLTIVVWHYASQQGGSAPAP